MTKTLFSGCGWAKKIRTLRGEMAAFVYDRISLQLVTGTLSFVLVKKFYTNVQLLTGWRFR